MDSGSADHNMHMDIAEKPDLPDENLEVREKAPRRFNVIKRMVIRSDDLLFSKFNIRPFSHAEDKLKVQFFAAQASAVWTIVLILIKGFLGVYMSSGFLLANAIYSVGIAMSKFLFRWAYRTQKYNHITVGWKSYCIAGCILIVFSLIFVVYCIGMVFFGLGSGAKYTLITALAVATISFVEVGISIAGVVGSRKKQEPAFIALRLTNAANALVAMALTQVAILSFTIKNDTSQAGGLGGIVFGGLSLAIGIFMVIESYRKHLKRKSPR